MNGSIELELATASSSQSGRRTSEVISSGPLALHATPPQSRNGPHAA